MEARISRDTIAFLMKVQVAVEAERTADARDLSAVPLARPADGRSRREPMLTPTRGLRSATASAPALAPAMKAKVGRNDPCPCGSGKKYKKCCGA